MASNGGLIREELQCLRDGHVQHFGDVLTFEGDIECVAVVTRPLTHLTGNIDVGQKVHFNLYCSVA